MPGRNGPKQRKIERVDDYDANGQIIVPKPKPVPTSPGRINKHRPGRIGCHRRGRDRSRRFQCGQCADHRSRKPSSFPQKPLPSEITSSFPRRREPRASAPVGRLVSGEARTAALVPRASRRAGCGADPLGRRSAAARAECAGRPVPAPARPNSLQVCLLRESNSPLNHRTASM